MSVSFLQLTSIHSFLSFRMARLEIILIVFWQLILIFNIQQLMPIFLNFMPAKKCAGDNETIHLCYEVKEKCSTCVENCEMKNSLCYGDKSCVDEINDRNSHLFYSAAEEFGLYCERDYNFLRIETVQYVGLLIGTIPFGFASDYIGRRKTLLFSLLGGIPSLAMGGEMRNVKAFLFFRFILGIFSAGTLVVGWAYVSELIKPKRRMLLRVFSSWPNARFLLTLICFTTMNWRWAIRVNSILVTPALLLLIFLLPESHIWLATNGRKEEHEKAVKWLNWLAGYDYAKKVNVHVRAKHSKKSDRSHRLRQIFVHPQLRKRLFVLVVIWFVTFYSTYSLDLNSDSMLNDDFFTGQFIMCAVISFTKFIMGGMDYFVPGMNRRKLHQISQASEVFCVVILIVLSSFGEKGTPLYMLWYLSATVCIELCMDVCTLIVNELIPTEVRGVVSGCVSMIGRIAMVAAGFSGSLRNKWDLSLFISIIVTGTLCWIVSLFFLDETKGTDLKDVGRDAMRRKEESIKSNATINYGFQMEENGKKVAAKIVPFPPSSLSREESQNSLSQATLDENWDAFASSTEIAINNNAAFENIQENKENDSSS